MTIIHGGSQGIIHGGRQKNPGVKSTDYTFLEIYTEDKGGPYLRPLFGDGDISTTGGGSGWVSVQRPQAKTLTVWRGPQAGYQHEIPLIIDRISTGESVEDECRTLEIMAGINQPDYQEPPVLILNANGALANDIFHAPTLRWIIPEEPAWGEAIRRDSDGSRIRQVVTVKFMVHGSEATLNRNNSVVASSRSVIAKAGDTYKKIAARYLKKDGGVRWVNRLAQLNGARDGASKPHPGQLVKLPTTAQVRQWERTPRR